MINRDLQAASHPISLLLLSAWLLSGCVTGGDGGNGGAMPESLSKVQGTYRIEGGKIINENRIRLHIYCSNDEVVTEPDTLENDTIPFEIDGNSLILFNSSLDTMESGAIVQDILTAKRVGTGASLTGQWQYSKLSYRILEGALGTEEKFRIDGQMERDNARLALSTFQVLFSGGVITTFEDYKTAELFLLDWNEASSEAPVDADSARYDISVRVIGIHEVEMKGRLNGEIVLLTLENDRSETFQSSDPTHPFHRYDRTPKSCPNEPEPEWYRLFLDANYKQGTETGNTP